MEIVTYYYTLWNLYITYLLNKLSTITNGIVTMSKITKIGQIMTNPIFISPASLNKLFISHLAIKPAIINPIKRYNQPTVIVINIVSIFNKL